MYILCQELAYKHNNYGRVGAIKLEQLDKLLQSLKTYWNYDISINATLADDKPVVQLEYEL